MRGGVDRRAIRAQSEAATAIQASVRSNLAKKRALAASPSSPALLDRTTVRGGLHTLGRDPHTLRPCYIACSVADKGLLGVAALKDFPLLQTLDISGNQIEDLQPLAALPFLQVKVSLAFPVLSAYCNYLTNLGVWPFIYLFVRVGIRCITQQPQSVSRVERPRGKLSQLEVYLGRAGGLEVRC